MTDFKPNYTVDPVTRELNFVSVSQLTRFDATQDGGCPAKWWLKYIGREKEPEKEASITGTEAHARIEHYERTGEDVLGKVERPGKHLLMTGSDLLVEWGLNDQPRPEGQFFHEPEGSLLEADGLKVVGFMDLVNARGVYVTPEGELEKDPNGTVEVNDHKTGKKIDKYAKEGAALIHTPQMSGYGVWAKQRFPWATHIRLSHTYFATDTKLALKKTQLFSLQQTIDSWQTHGHAVVREMREVARAHDHSEVPFNLAACSQFGGCAFRPICIHYKNANIYDRLKHSKGRPMALMSKVKDALNKNKNSPPNGAPSNGATAVAQTAAPNLAAVLTAKQAEQNKLYKLPNGQTALFLTGVASAGASKQSFIPVDDKGVPAGTPVLLEPESPITPATIAPPPPPPGSKVETKAEPAKETKAKKKDTAPEPRADGIALYINAVPTGSYRDLAGYVEQISAAVAKEYGLDDIRMQPNADHALSFGRWQGALATAVRKSPPENGRWVVATGDTRTDIVVGALIPIASEVVRSIR